MIYLLEDDDSIRKLVTYALQSQGFEARGFALPSRFREALRRELPRLVLLDIMLPEEDGLSVLTSLRKDPLTASLPVIMLTARNSEYDRAYGLDMGADDYICKPFGMMELLARVRALLRRTEGEGPGREYRFGGLVIRPEQHLATLDGEELSLTYKEFRLLTALADARGAVLTRETLMDRIWGLSAEPENRTLDVHIRTLRSKLGPAASLIETVRGVGFRMKGGAE